MCPWSFQNEMQSVTTAGSAGGKAFWFSGNLMSDFAAVFELFYNPFCILKTKTKDKHNLIPIKFLSEKKLL